MAEGEYCSTRGSAPRKSAPTPPSSRTMRI
jgi:hypothetical protein